ncbi:MAG: UDP-glucose--hexose-1-phosphate uridylyltransferase [Defluviitaleaceae bacterium]|nr:UDP-glucose--hexose-1-phosphate uridylyltransferase [Defluviitaleaceae bacterium]
MNEEKLQTAEKKAAVEALLQYALNKGLLQHDDAAYSRNLLYGLIKIPPSEVDQTIFSIPDARAKNETVSSILADLFAGAKTTTETDMLEAAAMGMLMPRPSEISKKFYEDYSVSPALASDEFYKLCRAANYIQVDRIRKNLFWRAQTEYGELDITINLAKPEKDPRKIALAKNAKQSEYPKCLLCTENVGFAGTHSHPARQNLRVIPLTLGGERWYFQFSPYLYYDEHCIVLNEKHVPMKINRDTFVKLLQFANFLPHYFIGSNADLPVVGGSILSHDHFQGGRCDFPMNRAVPYARFENSQFKSIKACAVKWPLTVIRLEAEDGGEGSCEQLADAAEKILGMWRVYADEKAGVSPQSGDTPHNTITPIVRHNRSGKMEMDLVLRNNRATDEHPYGLFHPHTERHHIKKENIGLIEVMGLAILPGRLKTELAEISRALSGKDYDGGDGSHAEWAAELLSRYGNKNAPETSEQIVRDETGAVFADVLRDCGVFKDDSSGRESLKKFLLTAGFKSF